MALHKRYLTRLPFPRKEKDKEKHFISDSLFNITVKMDLPIFWSNCSISRIIFHLRCFIKCLTHSHRASFKPLLGV